MAGTALNAIALIPAKVPKAKPMPFICRGCKEYFSVRTGSALQDSRLPFRKWVFAIYLEMTSLKGVSSHEASP